MLALSLTACTAVRIQIQATTVCPVLPATRDPSHLVEVWSKLLLINRQVQPRLSVKQHQSKAKLIGRYLEKDYSHL